MVTREERLEVDMDCLTKELKKGSARVIEPVEQEQEPLENIENLSAGGQRNSLTRRLLLRIQ